MGTIGEPGGNGTIQSWNDLAARVGDAMREAEAAYQACLKDSTTDNLQGYFAAVADYQELAAAAKRELRVQGAAYRAWVLGNELRAQPDGNTEQAT